MTIFEFAFFRCARQTMTPDELEAAQALAAKADAGNAAAASTLRTMCDVIVRRQRRGKSNGKTGGSEKRQPGDGDSLSGQGAGGQTEATLD